MIKHYLKIAWRNIVSNKFYTLIQVLGLGLGIVCCLFIYLFIDFHRSFDNYHSQADRIFRLVNELHLETTEYNKGASYAMYSALNSRIPAVDKSAFLIDNQEFTIRIDEQLFQTGKHVAFTSSSWFELFDYRWIQGGPEELNHPGTAVLTKRIALKFFGDNDPIGKIIQVESKYSFKVIGVIENKSSNTSLKSNIYLSIFSLRTLRPNMSEDFYTKWDYINSTNNLFISLKSVSQYARVEQTLMRLAKENLDPAISKYYNFKLLPLKDMHLDRHYGGGVHKVLLCILVIIGVFIMVIAVINYINLSIAQQARRSFEIGIRRVFGGSRWQLFLQFMVESTVITLFAMVFALLMLWVLLPVSNEYLFVNEHLQILSWSKLWKFLIGFWLLVSLGTGIYPAYLLGRLKIFKALKNNITSRNHIGGKTLIVLQNAVTQLMVIASIVIVSQVQFLQNTDIGFKRSAIIILQIPQSESGQKRIIDNYLQENSQVLSHTFCYRTPGSNHHIGGTVRFDQRAKWEPWATRYALGDTAYINTFGIRLISGRNISNKPNTPEYLINEKMMSMLGYTHPDGVIGKSLIAGGLNDTVPGIIVGVIQDFNTNSLLVPIEPTIVGNIGALQSSLAIKLSGNNMDNTLVGLEQQWKNLFPNDVFDYQFLDDRIDLLYQNERLQQRLIWLATTIAIIISVLGLMGMISLITFMRNKEIGIRKVLGASVSSIVALLSKEFIKLVLIAIVIATPIAWYAMNRWLQGFAYRIELQWWMFAGAGLVAVVIAILTISGQSVRAAMADPVDSLRSE